MKEVGMALAFLGIFFGGVALFSYVKHTNKTVNEFCWALKIHFRYWRRSIKGY